MKKIKNTSSVLINTLLLFFLFVVSACTYNNELQNEEENRNSAFFENLAYGIDFTELGWSKNADSLHLRFRIVDKKINKKVFWENMTPADVKSIIEYGSDKQPRIKDLKQLDNDSNRISSDSRFLLLVDRSDKILPEEIENIQKTINEIVKTLPDSTVYISFMDSITTESKLICESNFSRFSKEFAISNGEKNLYHSIADKFSELLHNKLSFPEEVENNYLIVFTDGKVNPNNESTPLAVADFFKEINDADNSNDLKKVIIHTFRYGDDTSNDNTLEHICTVRKADAIGEFYPAEKTSDVMAKFAEFKDDLSADYELTLTNLPRKIYNGQELLLKIGIEKADKKAGGNLKYAIGSKERPVITGSNDKSEYFAIFWGLVVIFVAFFIMQVIIPYITHKLDNFEAKHVVEYEPLDDETAETCTICQDMFMKGEKVVTVCDHKAHWECWKENDYKCVEYGQNCSVGIQHHFDKEHPFDLTKSPYYLKWALSGMIGGLITWIIYKVCFDFYPFLFENFTDMLIDTFYQGEIKPEVRMGFIGKVGGFLLSGILLGFILTLLFSYINEFRQKKFRVLMTIFLRAVIGSILGFVSFLIGSIICIRLGAYANNLFIDWIPWLLFGATIGLCLSVKTTIKWQHALIGGIISGILSFFLLYSTHFLGFIGTMLGFMLCSAGLGISIVTVHHVAQKYFLKYQNDKKTGEIAIHKWMSVLGGSNEVTIGKANDCVIQMNWDSDDSIHEKQVKLYIDKKRNLPILKVLEEEVIFDGRQTQKNNEYILKDNVKFTIGATEFSYVEKK